MTKAIKFSNLAAVLDIEERLAQEKWSISQPYVLVPLDEYAKMNGVEDSYTSVSSKFLNDCLVKISDNLDLIAALRVGGVRLEFAHFNLPKPAEKTSPGDNPNLQYWLQESGDIASYEGYSHLELGPNGLEVAIQRAAFFEEFSDSNPQKLWLRMEKRVYPTFFVQDLEQTRVVCASANNGGKKVIEPVADWMRQISHTLIRYKGGGVMEYDALHCPLYKVSKNLRLERKHQEEFEELTPEYVERTLNKAIRDVLK